MLADCISMQTRTWRCVVVLLVAVAGIVTGLLAMHVVGTASNHLPEPTAQHVDVSGPASPHAAASPASGSHAAATPSATLSTTLAATGGCAADGCDPAHDMDMTVLVCTLALLAATLLLLAPALSRALLGSRSRAAAVGAARAAARTVGRPPPPSLLVLSVDRR